MNKKKTFLTILLVMSVALVGGACGYFGIAYLKAGGDAEGVLHYIEVTVIPALIPAAALIGAAFMSAMPIINKVRSIVGIFTNANDNVESVKESGSQSVSALNAARAELVELKVLIGGEVDALRHLVQENAEQYKKIKSALEIAFTNNAELVKNGYAKQIYNILESQNVSEKVIVKR